MSFQYVLLYIVDGTIFIKIHFLSAGYMGCIEQMPAVCNLQYWSLAGACTKANSRCYAIPAPSGNGTVSNVGLYLCHIFVLKLFYFLYQAVGCYTAEEVTTLITETGVEGGIYVPGTSNALASFNLKTIAGTMLSALVVSSLPMLL